MKLFELAECDSKENSFEPYSASSKKPWKLVCCNIHRNPGILSVQKNENPVCKTRYGMKV